MQVKVGQTLRFQNETWLVSKISENKWTEFAGCNAREYQELYIDCATNHMIIDRHFDDFDRQDIVEFERNEVVLEQPGKDIFFLVPKLHARKVVEVKPESEDKPDGVLRDSTDVPVGGIRPEEPVADVRGGLGSTGTEEPEHKVVSGE